MTKLSISQSLQKDFRDYQKKEFCGILFDALWISRTTKKEPSDAMMLGRWFEYLALGPWRKGAGTEFGMPQGELAGGFKAAGKKAVEAWDELLENPWGMNSHDPDIYNISDPDIEAHWTAKYVNLWHQAKHFRATIEAYGIEILSIQQKHILSQGDHWQRTMVWDVYAQVHKMPDPDGGFFKPHYAIIDTKATGLINDGWQPYGWDEHKLIFKDKILIQALDYMDLARDLKDIPVDEFYFYVAANTNDVERKIFKVPVHDSLLNQHRAEVQKIVETIDFERFKGWKPYPDLKRCEDCPLKESCEYRAHHPRVNIVQLI